MSEQTTLRAALESAFDKAEQTEVIESPASESTETVETTPEQRARDEQGRFAPKAEVKPEAPAQPTEQPPAPVVPNRPTTWKKEYLPLWDKMASGQTLTPEEAVKLAQYTEQRETEYKTGVSTYKTAAQEARELQDAMAPFMPELQQHNIRPTEWIRNLGNAHRTLALGDPQQKLQMFAQLAKDYGVPLEMVGQVAQGQGIDPSYAAIMNQLQNLQGELKQVHSWKEQQEQQRANQAIAELAGNPQEFPHFEKVKGTMSQLLGAGFATDLKAAYKQAVRLNDEVFQEEQQRLSQAASASQIAERAAAAAQAKAKVISPRSATPSGTQQTTKAKDRRSMLEEAFSMHEGRV